MATATQLELPGSSTLSIAINVEDQDMNGGGQADGLLMDEAAHLASLCRPALNHLASDLSKILNPSQAYTADEILALPLDQHRIPKILHDLPSRKSARHNLAVAVAGLLHPVHEGSLTAVIRYNADRVHLRAWAVLQRTYDRLRATRRNGRTSPGMTDGVGAGVQAPVWASRIMAQGPWDPAKKPVSLDGVEAIPMPVQVAAEEELAPFLEHLENGGTHELQGDEKAVELDGGNGEPYYGVPGAEFRRGVVYGDGRMDLCKMVVGPDHIWRLMSSLRTNTFVRHFLLGNNIIGPSSVAAISNFIKHYPDHMETWYLAGNCITGNRATFGLLVDALVTSSAVTNVWLKRNPLGPHVADDIARLIINTENLETLDLDQTELGDAGVAHLFRQLAAYSEPKGGKLALRHVYLNGNGISTEGAAAIGSFLASPNCGLQSLYMSCNPLGDEGAKALAAALPKAPFLARLHIQSVGISTQGAVALCEALTGHPGIRSLDLGQAYATEDLGQAYNYIDDAAMPAIAEFLRGTPEMRYFNLGHCATTPPGLLQLTPAILANPGLLYHFAVSILEDPTRKTATLTPKLVMSFPGPDAPSLAQIKSDKAIKEHLEANVCKHYGRDMSYAEFMAGEKRWLVNDKSVRKIDSVYRNRDAGLARRHLMTLVKNWDEGDDTLEKVLNTQGAPSCSLRRR